MKKAKHFGKHPIINDSKENATEPCSHCRVPGAPGSGARYLGLGFPYRSALRAQKSRTKRKGPVPGTGPHILVIGCGGPQRPENATPSSFLIDLS
jgi:hypothetical protein